MCVCVSAFVCIYVDLCVKVSNLFMLALHGKLFPCCCLACTCEIGVALCTGLGMCCVHVVSGHVYCVYMQVCVWVHLH